MLQLLNRPIMPRSAPRPRPASFARVTAYQPEPVELCARRYGYFPLRFRWRGRLYHVHRVLRTWERAGRSYRAPRRYFQLLCDDGQYTLFQDLQVGTWHLAGAAVS